MVDLIKEIGFAIVETSVGLKGSDSNNVKELEKCIRTGETYDFRCFLAAGKQVTKLPNGLEKSM